MERRVRKASFDCSDHTVETILSVDLGMPNDLRDIAQSGFFQRELDHELASFRGIEAVPCREVVDVQVSLRRPLQDAQAVLDPGHLDLAPLKSLGMELRDDGRM